MTDFVAAQAGILELHARYTDAVWRQDCDAFAACFAEDGEWRISGMVLRGRVEIQNMIARILSRANRILITFRSPILEVGEGKASGRTYVDERCSWKDGETNIAIGRYYEHFVEEGDRWRFRWRLFELHYRGPADLTGTWLEHPDYGPPPAMPPLDVGSPDTSSVRWGLKEA